MTTPTPRPGILDIEPYVPGESELPAGIEPIKLSSNETPLGPSPAALEAFAAAGARLERYPDGQATRLRKAIGEVHDLDWTRIVCGAGSDELLNLLAQAYLGPGDEAVYTRHGFLVYRIAILANGATPVIAEETDDLVTDIDAILGCVTERTKMVFLANPNNPTGTYVGRAAIRDLRQRLPENVILVLDGAYAEYVGSPDYDAGTALVDEAGNTVITRTFSKIHGLAALRLGWAYMPTEIADVINRIRGPFNTSSPALAAGEAAIRDRDHVARAREHNDLWLARYEEAVRQFGNHGLALTPSCANFVLLHVRPEAGRTAADLDTWFKQHGIIVRRVGAYGLPNALRISIGTDAENEKVLEALKAFCDAAPESGGQAAQ